MNIKYIVITCEKYHLTRVQALKDTWAKNEKILFLSDVNQGDDIIGYPFLQKGYENIWMKLYEFLRTNNNFDEDWYFFTDDDTYVNKRNIKSLLSEYNSNDKLCLGHVGILNVDATDADGNYTGFPLQTIIGELTQLPIRYVSGGAGFILSKSSMISICKYLRDCEYSLVPRSYNSDVTFGFWLRNCEINILDIFGFWWTNPKELKHDVQQIQQSFTYHYVDVENMTIIQNICEPEFTPKNCIITQSKDQSQRLHDWVLYHFEQGFDTFVFFDDFSEDNSLKVLEKLRADHNINIITKFSDGLGNKKSREEMTNSESYGGDVSINYRIIRSYNQGLSIIKNLNPEALCLFIDVDEFLVSNSDEKVSEVIKKIMIEKNTDLVYIHSFDIKNDYDLEDWYICSDNSSLRWSYLSRSQSAYKNRGKSACIANTILEIKQLPNYVHQLREVSDDEKIKVSFDDYDRLRIHHFRKPNLSDNNIEYVKDFTLIKKSLLIKNKYKVNFHEEV